MDAVTCFGEGVSRASELCETERRCQQMSRKQLQKARLTRTISACGRRSVDDAGANEELDERLLVGVEFGTPSFRNVFVDLEDYRAG